jgi:ATP-dependent DNA helicase RecG
LYNILVNLTDELTPALLRTTQPFIDALQEMGIRTAFDLLHYFPRTHEDLSHVSNLLDAPLNEKVALRGTVQNLKAVRTRSRKIIVQANFLDETGNQAQIIWFNQPHILRMLRNGQVVTLTGKVTENGLKLVIQSPVFEDASRVEQLHAGRIVAVYPQTERIASRWLREKMALLKGLISSIVETLPPSVLSEENLIARSEAISALHFPTTPEQLQRARERMAFEELYAVQMDALERKKAWQGERQDRLRVRMDVELIKAFFQSLNFTPTVGQKVAIYEILRDMEQDRSMSRLLEGDVGSGKTLVAVAVIANVLSGRGQCAFMVPTEVLAKQHSTTVTRLLLTFHSYIQSGAYREKGIDASHLQSMPPPRVALLTGSVPQSEADAIRRSLAAGLIDVVIGTHALIEDSVRFKDLKLAIVDEQHRFGVVQRQRLKEKGSPHFLSMTATPIPRTLALTAYGDHDLSVLLEKPGQRKKIITKVVSPGERKTVELFIDQQIEKKRQAFVICPLIHESKDDAMLEVKNVEAEVERLQFSFRNRRIGKLHGRLSAEEKAKVMQDFLDRRYDILVSTSVIEVGIDVPNSTIIVIEGSERFGLSQLHQFRGRVGRSDDQSYCFLFTTSESQAKSERLKAMEQHDSGFMLAEIDLKLRGPGELFGFRQSGIPDLRFGSLLNVELVVRARRAAERVLGIVPLETKKSSLVGRA